MRLGDLGRLLDILFLRHFVVLRTANVNRSAVAVKADLLQRVCIALMRQAVALSIRLHALLIVVVRCAARQILSAIQMPYNDLLTVCLLQSLPARAHCVKTS